MTEYAGMKDDEKVEIPHTGLRIGKTDYALVLERLRGVGIYTNDDRGRYLRIGSPELVAKELGFHRRLLEMGFPVAAILEEGRKEESAYWVEESLGAEHMSAHFKRDTDASKEISEESFGIWLQQVGAMREAQVRTCEIRPYDYECLAKSVGEDGMEDELPDFRNAIRAAWEKAKGRIKHLPICLTHGDFTSHNVMEKGVIDFGDHFEGHLGYDIVTAITVPFWFPKDQSYEFFQMSCFSKEQIERFLLECATFKTPHGNFALGDYFDDLFFLKANWWAVRNHRAPKLQAWRYERYCEVVNRYIKGESLNAFWQQEILK